MQIYKQCNSAIIAFENKYYQTEIENWDDFINRKGLFNIIKEELKAFREIDAPADFKQQAFDPPVGSQEIWAAGVTYQRSKVARMEESKKAGGGDFYDKVYAAPRPELFFKSMPQRAVGNNGDVYIRRDSTWNVPEPELTLFISSAKTIEAYTIGNDMSSRSIEGENPLYLPQAKVYDRSAALGPCLYVSEVPIPMDTTIALEIVRNNELVFKDAVQLSDMKRQLPELADYLYAECDFDNGCFLMTGTSIVPPDDFTLALGDEVKITIDHIGTLNNKIAQKA